LHLPLRAAGIDIDGCDKETPMTRTTNWYSPFIQLRREMEDLFNNVGIDFASGRTYPPLNIWSDGNNIMVEAEMPGVKSEDLEILAVGNELTIRGRRRPIDGEKVTFHRQERGLGEFSRVVALPVEVDADRIEARLADGVLTLTLPKAESARPRQVKVKPV
jgi:HSP20 family protein